MHYSLILGPSDIHLNFCGFSGSFPYR